MTAVEDKCDICGRPPMVGVASIPAFPVSVAWCPTCLAIGAFPIWCLESLVCDEDMSIAETIDKHGDKVLGVCADWFMESVLCMPPHEGIGPVWYIKIGDYLERLLNV